MLDDSITVGDYVISYDFEHRTDCYVVGQVVQVGRLQPPWPGDCARYLIRVDRQMFEGRKVTVPPEYVCPPVNGTPSVFGGVTRFVVKQKHPA